MLTISDVDKYLVVCRRQLEQQPGPLVIDRPVRTILQALPVEGLSARTGEYRSLFTIHGRSFHLIPHRHPLGWAGRQRGPLAWVADWRPGINIGAPNALS